MMIKKIHLALILSLFTISINAQSLRAYESAAKAAANANDYIGALGYYQIIIEEAGDKKLSNYYAAAEAARMAKAFKYSASYYQYVMANDNTKEFTDAEYWLAFMQKSQGNYLEASKSFEQYASAHSANTTGKVEKAKAEVEVCKWAAKVVENNDGTDINQLSTDINTGYAEFAPVYFNDVLYYTSMRYGSDVQEGPILGKLMTAEKAEYGVTLKGNVNTANQHVANAAFNADGSMMYYTICEDNEIGRNCGIYSRTIDGDDFGQPVKLPKSINKMGSNNTQPNFAIDNAGNEMLYFVSDRNGGAGGMDIWVSKIDQNGNYGESKNLNAINTAGNDITPFYHSRSNVLYFATDGYKSLGGLDIYAARKTADGWKEPKHGGYPLNSPLDDAYLSLNERGDVAYFSSMRSGATCLDSMSNCVCNDIYRANRAVVDLIVNTYNSITKEPLAGTEVALLPELYDSEIQLDEEGNEYFFGLDFENGYNIKGTKEGYTLAEDKVDTYGDNTSRTITRDLYLTPNVQVDALVFDQRSGEPLNGVKLELYKLDDNGLVESKIELDKNNFNFPLEWMTKYRIVATKDGYIPDQVDIYTDNIPVIPTSLLENLFLCRQPFANYPFIALFFDNDYPKIADKNDERIAVNNYEETYRNYANELKRKEFIDAFSQEEEKTEIRNFFSEVDEGFVRLERFAENLSNLLSGDNSRDTVVVTLKGYASPRSTNVYNDKLTSRRINSMEQYLAKYKDGILKTFLADDRIQIKREPFGEEKATGGSEDLFDRKASVYAVEASKERRLEIIRVTTSKYVCPDDAQKF